MYPKNKIRQLNLRREVNRRLLLVKRRVKETPVEMQFAQGKIAALPESLSTPPDWALDAARLAWKTGLGKPFAALTPDEIKKNPRAAMREIIGIYEGLLAFVAHPSPIEDDEEIAKEAIGDLRKQASRLVAKGVLAKLKKLDGKFDRLLPPASQTELIEFGDRYKRGVKATEQSDDGLLGAKSLTTKIYYLVWFLWPELVKRPHLTAKELHGWLADSFGIYASEKLIEAIHSKLKLSGRWSVTRSAT